MQLVIKLFSSWMEFVYHTFDRVVINGYLQGKLHTTLEPIEHGRHVFRAYWKNSCLRQYDKFRTFMRLELLCNCLPDLRLKKDLSSLEDVRATSRQILPIEKAYRKADRAFQELVDLIAA